MRNHLELGGKRQWLAGVIVDILDVGGAHHVQVFRLELFVQEFGDQGFQYPLADIGGELLLNQGGGDLAGPETR